MRSSTTPSRRDGFTLIELLVVISILSILAALTLAGISRVRAGQHRATTEGTVKKLQIALNQQITTAFEEASKESSVYLPAVTTFCDGDKDRAKALLCYFNAKREFPQTFPETKNFITIPGVFAFPPHSAFAKLPNTPSGLSPDQESAVLLYLIVTEKANKGTSSTGDAFASATMTITSTSNVDYTVFKDGYGTHLAFIRWYGPYNGGWYGVNPEVQAPPYMNPKDIAQYGSVDRFDPLSKLRTWGNVGSRTAAQNALNFPAGSPPVQFDGLNKMITVISAGPDKVFGTGDDVFGYPLARLGAKGD